MKNLTISFIDCEVSKGATDEDVSREAVILALTHEADVQYCFNGKIYRVPYVDILDCIELVNDNEPSLASK